MKRPSAQDVLHGEYDPAWLLAKASFDLDRSMRQFASFHYAALDFAVAITSLADWMFIFNLRENRSWSNINPKAAMSDFSGQVAAQSDALALFFDLANEFKHADRMRGSKALSRLIVHMKTREDGEVDPECIENSITQRSVNGTILIPFIQAKSGDAYFFKDTAQQALNWWTSFNPAAFTPTTAK